jgi:hypothetical protein
MVYLSTSVTAMADLSERIYQDKKTKPPKGFQQDRYSRNNYDHTPLLMPTKSLLHFFLALQDHN